MDTTKTSRLLDESIKAVGAVFHGLTEPYEDYWPKSFPDPRDEFLGVDPDSLVAAQTRKVEKSYQAFKDFYDELGDFFDEIDDVSYKIVEKSDGSKTDDSIWVIWSLTGETADKMEVIGSLDRDDDGTFSGDSRIEADGKEFKGRGMGKKAAAYVNSLLSESLREQGPDLQVGRPEQSSDELIRDEFSDYVGALIDGVVVMADVDEDTAYQAFADATTSLEQSGDLPQMPDPDDGTPEEINLWLAAARGVEIALVAMASISAA